MTTELSTDTARTRRHFRRDGLFQRNDWWWIDYYDAEGKRHRKKAAPDYQTAKLILRETHTAIARGEVLGIREEGMRLREFVERVYWPAVKETLSPIWRELSWGILERSILPRFGAVKLSAIRQDDIERWYAERLARVRVVPKTRKKKGQAAAAELPISVSTANKEFGRVKHLLGRAVAWRYLKQNPARDVQQGREGPGRVRYLTADEREQLLAGANPVLRLYILAALQTAARRGELAQLRWADVDLKRRLVTFPKTKNGDRRAVPITDSLAAVIEAQPRNLNPNALILPPREPHAITRAFARLVKRLGLRDLKFHDLRHDAASTLTMAGTPQRTIMEILGHRDPRMTLRYQHLAPEYLREAMRALDRPARSKGAAESVAR